MGSPVSVVVAEIIMQNIEEQALATYMQTVPLWLCNVDDTFTAIHKDGISDFHEHLKGAMSAGEHALSGYANYFQLSKFYCF